MSEKPKTRRTYVVIYNPSAADSPWKLQEWFDEQYADGFELVAFYDGLYVFKRLKAEDEQESGQN